MNPSTRLDPSAPWAAPDDVRRVARRRRTRRRLLAAGAVAVVAGGVLAGMTSGSPAPAPPVASSAPTAPSASAPPGPPVAIARGLQVRARSGDAVQLAAKVSPASGTAGAAAAVARGEQQFAFDLLRQTAPSGNDNAVLSPAGLAVLLAQLQTGARGSTAAEIARALRTSSLSAQDQDAGWASLLAAPSSGVTLETANALWAQRGLPLGADFMADLARYFRSGVWSVDFAHHLPDAVAAINAWTSRNTHGRITKLFADGDLSSLTELVVANAVYFKAAWAQAFDPKRTHDQAFVRGDGSTVQTPMMSTGLDSDRGLRGVVADGVVAAELPYSGGRYAAEFLRPTSGSLATFTAGLTPDRLAGIDRSFAVSRASTVSLPRFTLTDYTALNDPLQQLGVRSAFGGDADFGRLSPAGLSVGLVVQRDYLKVDEHGTEAAAVTGGAFAADSSGGLRTQNPVFDRPFLMLVRDTRTGTVLFTAQINDPSAG